MTDGDDGGDDLRRATLRGVRWIAIGRVVTETIALGSSVALARLVPPAEFGRAAVALIVVALAAILGPAGITAVLVQRREIGRSQLEATAFLALTAGVVFALLTVGLAHIGAPEVFGHGTAFLIGLAAPAWLLAAIGAVPQALLQRELAFRRVAIIDSISLLVGATVAVALAAAGLDGTAIVIGAVATTAVATAIAMISAPVPVPRPSARGIADVGGFAASVSASSLVYTVFRNVDYAILGARLQPASVGYYWRAYQLGIDYQGKISQIMLRVAFPVYSRAEGLDELRRLRRKIVRTHAAVIIPLMGVFIATAPELITRVYGAKWEPAVRPAQIMAVAGMAYAIATGTGPLMVAVGKPNALLAWSVCELVFYAILVGLLTPHGLVAVSIGVAAFAVASLLVIQTFLLRPYLGLPVRGLVDDILPGVVSGAGVLGTLLLLRLALEHDVPAIFLIAVPAAAGATVYVVLLRVLFAQEWSDLTSLLGRVSGR